MPIARRASDPLMHRWCRRWCGDGPGLSGTGARPAADHRNAEAGGNPLPPDAGARSVAARRGERRSRRRRPFDGETAFKLYDTYGFPARPDAGRAAPARRRGRHGWLQRRHGAAARRGAQALGGFGRSATEGVWFESSATNSARPSSSATRRKRPKASCQALVRDGAEVEKPPATRSIIVNQTPFYGESGGQQGDRARSGARRRHRGHRYAEKGRRRVRPLRQGGFRRRPEAGRRGELAVDHDSAPDPRQPLGHASDP
jgi:hypothetical protein